MCGELLPGDRGDGVVVSRGGHVPGPPPAALLVLQHAGPGVLLLLGGEVDLAPGQIDHTLQTDGRGPEHSHR